MKSLVALTYNYITNVINNYVLYCWERARNILNSESTSSLQCSINLTNFDTNFPIALTMTDFSELMVARLSR